jgi:hypothetical protein
MVKHRLEISGMKRASWRFRDEKSHPVASTGETRPIARRLAIRSLKFNEGMPRKSMTGRLEVMRVDATLKVRKRRNARGEQAREADHFDPRRRLLPHLWDSGM